MKIKKANRKSFTLVELLTVMAVIAILAGLILSTAGYAQKKAGSAKAESEIHAMSFACEAFKTDESTYPRDSAASNSKFTDKLDPKTMGDPTAAAYKNASLVLYRALSGDRDTDSGRKVDSNDGNKDVGGNAIVVLTGTTPKIYYEFKPSNLTPSSGAVAAVVDPFGNSYGYSTAYQADIEAGTNPPTHGQNPTFDLWSTAGSTVTPGPPTNAELKWIKNW